MTIRDQINLFYYKGPYCNYVKDDFKYYPKGHKVSFNSNNFFILFTENGYGGKTHIVRTSGKSFMFTKFKHAKNFYNSLKFSTLNKIKFKILSLIWRNIK